ncbi:hypothetical protein QTP88_025718 [Uroleucon formosanum]
MVNLQQQKVLCGFHFHTTGFTCDSATAMFSLLPLTYPRNFVTIWKDLKEHIPILLMDYYDLNAIGTIREHQSRSPLCFLTQMVFVKKYGDLLI